MKRRETTVGPPGVQNVIRRHYAWLKQFWTPNRESYAGHGQLIVDSDSRKAYEAHHPQLPEFAAAAMKAFAERELSCPRFTGGVIPAVGSERRLA